MGMKEDTTSNAGRTYAVGDLHGEVTLFRRLLETLVLTADDTLILLGDYVDRGEDSVATIELLTALVDDHHSAQVVALLGNHDAAWLEVWTGDGYRERPNIPGASTIWDASQGLPPLCIGQFLERIRHNVSMRMCLPTIPMLERSVANPFTRLAMKSGSGVSRTFCAIVPGAPPSQSSLATMRSSSR